MSSEKTEQPTHKKLKDAKEKGQIARSRDLAIAAASVAGTIALASLGERLIRGLGETLAAGLAHFADTPMRTVDAGELSGLVMQGGTTLAVLVGPIAMATMVAGVVTHGFQGGWSISADGLTLNWSRLSPASGIKKLGLSQSGADTLKTMISVAMITWFGWAAVDAVMLDSVQMPWMSTGDAALTAWSHLEWLLWRVAIGLGLLAIGDYGLQYYRHIKSLKMTKQEIKDEARSAEGSAEVKGRVRRIQADMSRRRMMGDVPRATVVITNPTHYAVALEYRRGEMAAPRVLAKGADEIALKIREKARQHGIPIVENKPLAQGLYATAEIGDTIPAPLFAAVAEVLAQLIRLKQLVL